MIGKGNNRRDEKKNSQDTADDTSYVGNALCTTFEKDTLTSSYQTCYESMNAEYNLDEFTIGKWVIFEWILVLHRLTGQARLHVDV